MKQLKFAFAFIFALLSVGCSGWSTNSSAGPSNNTAAACALANGCATLTWEASPGPDVAGYRIYYGQTSGVYTSQVDVGNTLRREVPNLTPGTYFFAVTAYNANGESPYSNEVSALTKALQATEISLVVGAK